MKTKEIEIDTTVLITYDETKFTEAFLKDFSLNFFNFKTVEEHLKHIAILKTVGAIGPDNFLEGYGSLDDFGISFDINMNGKARVY